MSNELLYLSKNILTKTKQVILAYNQLKKENKKLKKENENYAIQLKDITIEKTQTENEYDLLRIGKTLSPNPADVFISKELIDNLVREIDDCIVSLSKNDGYGT